MTKFDTIESALFDALETAEPGTLRALADAVNDFKESRGLSYRAMPYAARRLLDTMCEAVDVNGLNEPEFDMAGTRYDDREPIRRGADRMPGLK